MQKFPHVLDQGVTVGGSSTSTELNTYILTNVLSKESVVLPPESPSKLKPKERDQVMGKDSQREMNNDQRCTV